MTPETESTHLPGNHPAKTNVRPGIPEDQVAFRRWRLGFFIFYGAIASLLGGLAMVADRPGTFISAAAPTNPTLASTSPMRLSNEGRIRE
jgi:hypothetical protein